jgi:hypothetical protein
MINESNSFYEGPLTKVYGCATAHPALTGKTAYGDFQTHAASAWPSAFNRWVAIMAYNSARAKLSAARVLGGTKIASPRSTEEQWVDTSDDDSDGNAKPHKGAGTTGYGRPLDTVNAGKWKPFTDGNGLCSPGRWAPQKRMIEKSGTARNLRACVGFNMAELVTLVVSVASPNVDNKMPSRMLKIVHIGAW